MPYFTIENTEWTDGFIGLALTIGYIPSEKSFQIALTIGTYSIAFGLDFDF